MGRIVITHSTYLEGLLEKLKLISKDNNIKTITPGRISKTNGRRECLELKITTRIKGGFKLLARKGNSVQEVFLITEKDEDYILKLLEE